MQKSSADNEDMLGVPQNEDEVITSAFHDLFFQEDDITRCVPQVVDEKPWGEQNYFNYDSCVKSSVYNKLYQKQDHFKLTTLQQNNVGVCWLPLAGPVNDILQTIDFFFTDEKIDFSKPSPSEFVGYLFKGVTYALFNLLVYIREEDGLPGLRLRRLDGDAFLTTEVFMALREQLIKQDLVSEKNDPWRLDLDEEDLEDLEDLEEDDGEEMGDEEDLNLIEDPMYLELENDTGLIDYWMHDILESEYLDQRLYTLMTMAHNSEKSENLKLMLNHSNGKLLKSIMKVMEENSTNLPMIRSCVRTLNNIISGAENVNISWTMVKLMCECFLTWSQPCDKAFSYHRPVANSVGIQSELASSLGQLATRMNCDAPTEIRDSIEEVQIWLENERGFCHPEARENLEFFVQETISCR